MSGGYNVQTFDTSQQGALLGVKGLVYAKAGVGKTYLATTAPNVFVIATEPGLLSLARFPIKGTYAMSVDALKEVARWIAGSQEARQYETFLFDSVSETVEMILAAEKIRVGSKEPRRAYNELAEQALTLLRLFRDIRGPNIIFTAKQDRAQDGETGAMMFSPKFPGKVLGIEAPYFFDFVFHLHTVKDLNTGELVRVVRTQPDFATEAKDRSGLLAPVEPAHLYYLFNKIQGRV